MQKKIVVNEDLETILLEMCTQFQNKAWPQAPQQHFRQQEVPNQQLLQQNQQVKDIKHRDYLKQQQRLKAMPLSSSKVRLLNFFLSYIFLVCKISILFYFIFMVWQGMSADALIGNLLEKKDTFTPKQSSQGQGKPALDQHDLVRIRIFKLP